MINTLFLQDTLNTSQAFALSLLIGILFGFLLERAGFGSSRKLAGVFYLKDMTVIKVMFTAVIVAMLGLAFLMRGGWLTLDHIYFLPTTYGAQIVGGLLFGVGFVVGGWCPGTAAAGLAGGKLDALIFLVGAILGSIGFNEFFGLIKPLYTFGGVGQRFVYDSLGLSQGVFIIAFTVIGVICFALCEYVETTIGKKVALKSNFLKAFSLMLVVLAIAVIFLPEPASIDAQVVTASGAMDETSLLAVIEQAEDHIEPEELADRLVSGDRSLLLVDTRPNAEYTVFHIRGAVNIPLPDLAANLESYRQGHMIVLYSNGMTHPAQARDSLARLGFTHVYILTDGLNGFMERCLKPMSLRSTLVNPAMAAKIRQWRDFFYSTSPSPAVSPSPAPIVADLPAVVDTNWLAQNLGRSDLVVLDLRAQPDYSKAHIPGSRRIDIESLRGSINGLGSILLPADLLARHFGLLGINRTDTVILLPGVKFHDASLASMAFARLGHPSYAILNGGFEKWLAENRPWDQMLPKVTPTSYPTETKADRFTIDAQAVLQAVQRRDAVIIDVRPADYYRGEKSDEARAGHIPGAVNRPYTEDVIESDTGTTFKSTAELSQAYAALIPSRDSKVIVHCRTGHQASQTFFILTRLLGYTNALWYDAGWTEWAARLNLPIETSVQSP